MKKNMGTLDRGLRAAVGVGLLVAGAYAQSLWGLIGAIPLATAILGWCPLYPIFGISTCGHQRSKN